MSVIGLIPLRAGGTRVGLIDGLDKERAKLGNHPLMAYTIRHAIDSKVFDNVMAVTASEEHAAMAESYGAMAPFRRPDYTVRDGSPDIEWVHWLMKHMQEEYGRYDAFSILRVTSPFRTAEHIKEAWKLFYESVGADSLRTVTKVDQHPGKMWVKRQGKLLPLLPMGPEAYPWHSSATQEIFECYIQTAGMEFARTKMMLDTMTIAGSTIIPYVVEGFAALDINTRYDWIKAEEAIKNELVQIPESLK